MTADQLALPDPPIHPARTTWNRLGNQLIQWWDLFTDDERHAVAVVRDALDRIAEGDHR